jgi:cysteine desulfurase
MARRTIALRLGVPPKAVFFTSGATEANAWALHGADLPVIASAIEHPSVLEWADEVIGVDPQGVIDLEALEARLKVGPALVCVMAANNETGVIQPIEDVRRLCAENGSRFHCDATQWVGRMEGAILADSITISAHKLGGPRGVGALVTLDPPEALFRGGPQERGRRSGTLNVPGIIGFGQAVSECMPAESTERDALEAFCISRGAAIVGAGAPRLPNTCSAMFSLPGDLIVAAMDLGGLCASTGSACSSGSSQTSHVLGAMGVVGVPVRFSLGPESLAEHAIAVMGPVLDRMETPCAS